MKNFNEQVRVCLENNVHGGSPEMGMELFDQWLNTFDFQITEPFFHTPNEAAQHYLDYCEKQLLVDSSRGGKYHE